MSQKKYDRLLSRGQALPGAPKPGKFVPGYDPRRTGGKKKLSGAKGKAFIERAQQMVEDLRLLEVAGAIATADIGEKRLGKRGETIYSETRNSDRVRAIELIIGYAYGRPGINVVHQQMAKDPSGEDPTVAAKIVVYRIPDNGRAS